MCCVCGALVFFYLMPRPVALPCFHPLPPPAPAHMGRRPRLAYRRYLSFSVCMCFCLLADVSLDQTTLVHWATPSPVRKCPPPRPHTRQLLSKYIVRISDNASRESTHGKQLFTLPLELRLQRGNGAGGRGMGTNGVCSYSQAPTAPPNSQLILNPH